MILTENDTDILVIKEILRHSSYNSTTMLKLQARELA